MYANMYTVSMYVCVYMSRYVNVCTYIRTYMWQVGMLEHLFVLFIIYANTVSCIYVCIYMSRYVCTYVYVHTYIRTYL